jgi:hypothetical protein
MAPKSGAFKTVNNFAKLMEGVETLTNTVVLVGVPGDKAGRKEGEISNADLAYIHEHGSIDGRIPARPFIGPGILAVQADIARESLAAGKAIMKGSQSVVSTYLNRIGIIAVRSIKNVIGQGIPPPLAPSTIAGRIRRVKGKKRRQKIADNRAAGIPDSIQNGAEGSFLPLVVTGQLRNAITYVLRDQFKRKFVVNRDIRK